MLLVTLSHFVGGGGGGGGGDLVDVYVHTQVCIHVQVSGSRVFSVASNQFLFHLPPPPLPPLPVSEPMPMAFDPPAQMTRASSQK